VRCTAEIDLGAGDFYRFVRRSVGKVASERGTRDLGEAVKEKIGRRSRGKSAGEAGGGVECASIDAADQWLSVGLGVGSK
jgi:hypothetical protein